MYCRKCGNMINDDAEFCPFCGESVVPVVQYEMNNTMAVVALVFSFLSPILGWIFGVMALKRTALGFNRKGMAKAAIIIATINFVFNVYLMASGEYDAIINQLLGQ